MMRLGQKRDNGETSVNIAIRRQSNADAETMSQAFAGIGWNKPVAQFRRYFEQQRQQRIIVFVAECDNIFAGYLKVVWDPEYAHFRALGVPEIQDLNVLPKFRRHGVATALMDVAEQIAASRNDRVGIGVGLHPGYNAAQRMYVCRDYIPDRLGVTWRGEYIQKGQDMVADDDLVLYLEKELLNFEKAKHSESGTRVSGGGQTTER